MTDGQTDRRNWRSIYRFSIVSRSKIGRIPDSPEPKSGATLSKSDNDVLAGGIESLMLSVPVKEFSHSE